MQELRSRILNILYGGLWHTTHPERFKHIIVSSAILPEPDIPDSERWKTERGKEYYPYVRSLGGVSLFDFDYFEPDSYLEEYPLCSWREFVPFRKCWDVAVWIEIDRECVSSNLISASDLLEQWKSNKAYKHTIMPRIEAAHLGPLPQTAFERVFLVRKGEIHSISL